jgi:hypothetical protein
MPLINEAAFCMMEGVATPEAVETLSGRNGHAPVASTSRKAIMSRNHFIWIPRFKPLMRKVTNADPNQS